jgi:acetoin utilization deacetylase AcuC-like enzyme
MLACVYHNLFLEHGVSWHPENAGRLQAITQRLHDTGLWEQMAPLHFSPASRAQLQWVHEPDYLDELTALCERGGGEWDSDTIATPQTCEAAAMAAGGAIAAAEAVVVAGDLQALGLLRPPGHHATADQAGGFCFLNNAALAAESALRSGAERVAILDFDSHHGNGLQELFYHRGDVLYLSIHQLDAFPGTGTVDEIGVDAGMGLNVNVPLPPGAGDQAYQRAWRELFVPLLVRYAPDLLLLEAGYDAHWRDPLCGMNVTSAWYYGLTAEALEVARQVNGGRLLVLLEGGYHPEALADSVENTVRALLDLPPQEAEAPPDIHDRQAARVEQYLQHALALHRERLGLERLSPPPGEN